MIAGIYGAIAWGLFLGSSGFRAHINFTQRLYNTGRPPVPHFLFHALTAALFAAHLAPSLVFAGRLVLVGCYVLIALVMYGLLWTVFQGSGIGRASILFLAALAGLVAQPITFAHAYTLGFFWPEPYEIVTTTVLKPFALASFACTAWYLFRRCKMDIRLASLFALATLAGSLSKPSFIICLLPASALLLIYRLARGLPVSLTGLIAGLYLPAVTVLAWQFYVTYSGFGGAGMYHDSIMWAPFKFMTAMATGLLSKFLLSIAFPLVVTVLYWKQASRDAMLQLAWCCFLFGAFYSYMLAEKAYWAAGNFVWSGYITLFTLFVAAMVFWLRQIGSANPRDWFQKRALFCGAVLALHAISGARMDWLYLTHYGRSLFEDSVAPLATVPGVETPTAGPLTPSSGTGTSQVFSARYSNRGGAAAFTNAYILLNTSFDAAAGCYVDYLPGSNGLFLMNDAGASFLGRSRQAVRPHYRTEIARCTRLDPARPSWATH